MTEMGRSFVGVKRPDAASLVVADRLVETPGNPIPPGGTVTAVTTRDGLRLRAAHWRPADGVARGTVLILQGRAEFIEKYFEVVGDLLSRGWAVAAFDWRGQGGSGRSLREGRLGHVRHFADFRHDVEAVAEQLLRPSCPGPVVGLAHSMGGCVALLGAAEGWLPVERLVATTPMIGLSLVRRTRLVRTVARLLRWAGLGGRLVPGGRLASISTEPFAGNRLSGDARRYARNAAQAHALGAGAIGSPTIGWLGAAYDAMARFEASPAPAIGIPTLVVAAGDDPVCSTPAIEAFARRLGPHAYLHIPGSRHEILMESDEIRAAFWAAFDRFTGDREPAPSPAQQVHDLGVEPAVAARQDGAAPGRRAAVP